MPLFGLRTTKKNEQSQIETSAGEAKVAARKMKKPSKFVSADVGEKDVAVQSARRIAMPKGSFSSETNAVIRPHITEKTGILSQNGVYTFQVEKNANKQMVAKAIKALYKVTPVKVGIVTIPARNVFIRGKKGSVPGMKKAMITVKKGEKIDFV